MLTIEALQEVFLEEKKPYWRLYSGRTTSGAKRGENTETQDVEESCDLLIRSIERYGNGVFTVAIGSGPKVQNSRCIQHTVKIEDGASVAGTSNGAGKSFSNLEQVFLLAERLNNQGAEGIGSVVESELDRFRMQIENERLKAEIKLLKKGTAKDRLIDGLVARSPQLLDRILGAPTQGIAGTIGFDEPTMADTPETDDTPAQSDGVSFSFDQAILAIQAIAEALPNQNPNQLLWKLAKFAQDDPVKAESLLTMM